MQHHKIQMGRRQFRIGDLAQELKVKKFVVRFWEREFDLKSDRSQGGQRFYTDEDLHIFKMIKDLLYNKGFTIAGAKKQLPIALKQDDVIDNPVTTVVQEEAMHISPVETPMLVASDEREDERLTPATVVSCNCDSVFEQVKIIKEKLLALRDSCKTA